LHGLAVERGWRGADGVEPARIGRIGDGRHRSRRRQIRVAAQITLFEHDVAERSGVPRRETAAPVVAGQAELAETGDSLDLSARRIEAKVAARDGYGLVLRIARPPHIAVAAAVSAVDPVVHSPGEAIDPKLLVAFVKSGQHHALLIGF